MYPELRWSLSTLSLRYLYVFPPLSRSNGIRALTLDEGDELINVMRTDGGQNILMATHNGQAICFAETDVRPMGREAVGVRGIRLRDGDWVVGAEIAQPDAGVLSITENGYGKRTPAADYIRGGEEPQHRGGSGMKNYNITDKTGPVAAVKVVYVKFMPPTKQNGKL